MKYSDTILNRCVFLDLEIHPKTEKLLKIGAWVPSSNRVFCKVGSFDVKHARTELLSFVSQFEFIVGHNIEDFDWPYLIRIDKKYEKLNDRIIDTLVLNPLAFPANPYHKLVKDYKLQKESVNDPVEDCKQTARLFEDQCHAFANNEIVSSAYRELLGPTSDSYIRLFDLLVGPNEHKGNSLNISGFLKSSAVCQSTRHILDQEIKSNDSVRVRGVAYVIAWLNIAGTNSILPPWVRRNYHGISDVLDKLRSKPCANRHCKFCALHHDPKKNLKKWFGYDEFRHFGKESGTKPLQEQIVRNVVLKQSTLAILPTGGGKSLCYQLPSIMLAQNRGMLTIIISPLQSLMTDQVDQLKNHYDHVAALNGSLTMPERKKVLEGVCMGDIHLLYVAPEQLRNKSFKQAISTREVGQWIVDEAHCLSKWGHDFRPDYLYLGKFIQRFCEETDQPIPPVHAFTATARLDVIDEIIEFFEKHLDQRMEVLSGGHNRMNLSYGVIRTPLNQKREQVLDLLIQNKDFIGNGAAIIFCSRRKTTEEMSEFLNINGFNASFFHAGLDPQSKRETQESFMNGETKIMAATCAFGMGVDKSDVRMVIHAQMPDSLENYLQEAGRAGRDGQASKCILLFDESDADKQFEIKRAMQIEYRDFVSLFEGIRKRSRKVKSEKVAEDVVFASSGEVLRSSLDSPEGLGFDLRDYSYDTKVRTAIAWMDEAGLLSRHENRTNVIQGTFKTRQLEAIRETLSNNKISSAGIEICMKVASALMQCVDGESMNTDSLADQTGLEPKAVFDSIRTMQHAGVLDHDLSLIAWLTIGTRGDSRIALEKLSRLEVSLFELIQEMAEGDEENVFQLPVHRVCHYLRKRTEFDDIHPHIITLLLGLWSNLDRTVTANRYSRDHFRLRWKMQFRDGKVRIQQRHDVSSVELDYLYKNAPVGEKGKIRIPFKLGELADALESDISTRSIEKHDEVAEQALLGLQKSEVLGLESGSAIFYPSMTLKIPKGTRKPSKKDFSPLANHYQAQIHQVHLMRKWAIRKADGREDAAQSLLDDYFNLPEKVLLTKHLKPEDRKTLNIPASHERIEEIIGKDVLSPIQREIVQQSNDQNMLVLAGPGSGKTRLIVHRAAWLAAVQRVAPESILILAFNRATVSELRRRLSSEKLLGNKAWRLEIHTYHKIAMKLIGEVSPHEAEFNQVKAGNLGVNDSESIKQWMDSLIPRATKLLVSDEMEDADDNDVDSLRSKLLVGFRYIFVDEYQDIDESQYELLSALAGRSLQDEEDKLTIFAVGDDDQNIYEWKGSSNKYIQRYCDDYGAEISYMVENYRSAPEVVSVTNKFIEQHSGRMKVEHPIHAVKKECGSVRAFLGEKNALIESMVNECKKSLSDGIDPSSIAILCRHHNDYVEVAQIMRAIGIPICLAQERNGLAWHRIKPIYEMISVFEGSGFISANDIRKKWELLPVEISEHPRSVDLWNWLDSHGPFGEVQRDHREWRGEIWELTSEIRASHEKGIHIGTMHSAKGLEFDTVFVLAGQKPDGEQLYPELRLRYVAMTRAERNLILMQQVGESTEPSSPWFDLLELQREVKISSDPEYLRRGIGILELGMRDVDLGFIGRLDNPPDTSLIQEGDLLSIDAGLKLLLHNNIVVGRLSKQMQERLVSYSGNGWEIAEIKVLAVLHRFLTDESPEFVRYYKTDKWEVVVPQFFLQQGRVHSESHQEQTHARPAPTPEKKILSNAGSPWTEEQMSALEKLYKAGVSVNQLASEFGRTGGAIRSQLKKQGLIEVRSDERMLHKPERTTVKKPSGKAIKRNKLEKRQEQNLENGIPRNNGLPWTDALRCSLKEKFTLGCSIHQLASEFERSPGGIISQLEKQGLISLEEKEKYLKS